MCISRVIQPLPDFSGILCSKPKYWSVKHYAKKKKNAYQSYLFVPVKMRRNGNKKICLISLNGYEFIVSGYEV